MKLYSVAEIARYIRDLLRTDELLADVWIQGEIGSLSRSAAGHYYFTLVDERSQLSCVMFRSAAAMSGIQPESGLGVAVHGAFNFYEAGGKCELCIDLLYPSGLGLAHLQFEALRVKLEQQGLFSPERKRPLPSYPTRIGLLTSDGGVVLHDILNVIGRRYPAVEIVFAHSAVQGDYAPVELIEGLGLLAEHHRDTAPLDLIIIARGGGSAEDLAAFNDERLARAVFGFPAPVVSAVGHETDFTILDFVADVRAPTPSAASELVTPSMGDLRDGLRSWRLRGLGAVQRALANDRLRQLELRSRLAAASPALTAQSLRVQLNETLASRAAQLQSRLHMHQEQLTGRSLQLEALGPLRTLERGYAVLTANQRAVVTSWRDVQPGDAVQARLADGTVHGEVTSADPEERPNGATGNVRREFSPTTGDDHRA